MKNTLETLAVALGLMSAPAHADDCAAEIIGGYQPQPLSESQVLPNGLKSFDIALEITEGTRMVVISHVAAIDYEPGYLQVWSGSGVKHTFSHCTGMALANVTGAVTRYMLLQDAAQ